MTPANMRFTPLGLSGGLVKSFIKRDTPTKRLTAKVSKCITEVYFSFDMEGKHSIVNRKTSLFLDSYMI